MTIAVETVRASFPGTGAQTVFPLPFRVLEPTHLRVALRAGDTETVLALGSGYTVANAGAASPASVTLATAPAVGTTVVVVRDVPITQPTQFVNQGAYLAAIHETQFDRTTMQVQQVADAVTRALQLGPADTDGSGSYRTNGNRIVGLPSAVGPTEPATLGQVAGLVGALPPGGSATTSLALSAGSTVPRTLADRFAEQVNVRDHGALGNGVANDTAAFLAADAVAAARGAQVYVPAGTYQLDPLMATTSWRGERGAVLRYRGTAVASALVTWLSVDRVTIEGLTVDGAVSADPVAWTAENMDSFTGARGLLVANCTGARILNCHARNVRERGFWIENARDVVVSGCTVTKSRGVFGDGFLVLDSIGVTFLACRAVDFTRIGFVVDTYGTAPQTCYHIRFVGCEAQNGHDAAIYYGGNEYNAGLWVENGAHVHVTDFTALDMIGSQGRGIVLCSGAQNNGVPGAAASFTVSGARCDNVDLGLTAYSLNTFPVVVAVDNVQVTRCRVGVQFDINLGADSFTCSNSHVEVDFTRNPAQTRAYAWTVIPGLPSQSSVAFLNCTVRHASTALAALQGYNTTTSSADIGAFTSETNRQGIVLIIDGVRNVAAQTPVFIGVPQGQITELRIARTYVAMAYAADLGAASATLDQCRCASMQLGTVSASLVTLRDCLIEGDVRLGGGFVHVLGGRAVLTGAGDMLRCFSTATGRAPGVVVSGLFVRKDIALGEAIRIGFGTVSFSALLSGVQFYHASATATGAHPFVRTEAGATVSFEGCLKDTGVTNTIENVGGGGAVAVPTGVRAIALR